MNEQAKLDKVILARDYSIRLCAQLGLRPDRVRRIVIDVDMKKPVLVYVEMMGDSRMLEITLPTGGIDVKMSSEQ